MPKYGSGEPPKLNKTGVPVNHILIVYELITSLRDLKNLVDLQQGRNHPIHGRKDQVSCHFSHLYYHCCQKSLYLMMLNYSKVGNLSPFFTMTNSKNKCWSMSNLENSIRFSSLLVSFSYSLLTQCCFVYSKYLCRAVGRFENHQWWEKQVVMW